MKQNITIAIADDHPIIVGGIKNMLPFYPHIHLIAAYTNAKELMEGLKEVNPDVLLLDIQMPDKTGDELVPVILKKYPSLKVLTLTNFDSSLYANNMLKRGAHGYLLKSSPQEKIIEGIDAVYNGEIYLEPSLAEKVRMLTLKEKQATFSRTSLTPREKEILLLIVEGIIMQEISKKLCISLRTVVNYRTSILLKLDAHNTAVLVKKAIMYGYTD